MTTSVSNNYHSQQLSASDSYSTGNIADFYANDSGHDLDRHNHGHDHINIQDAISYHEDSQMMAEDEDYDEEQDDDDDQDEEDRLCKHCGKLILEGHAYELGDDRWHINCFRCSKCTNLLGINSDFLVVGTGELVCENCFYDCQVCGKKIGDLAILAGNQPYCADCFVCKHCKNRIDNLRYAKTSSGLYCMNCHEKVLLKKKRLEHEKRERERIRRQQQKRNSGGTPSQSQSVNSSRNTTPIFEKSLPSIPPTSSATAAAAPQASSSSKAYNPQNANGTFNSPFETEEADVRLSPIVGTHQSMSDNESDDLDVMFQSLNSLASNSNPSIKPSFSNNSRTKKPNYERTPSYETSKKRKSVTFDPSTEGDISNDADKSFSSLTNPTANSNDPDASFKLADPPKNDSMSQAGTGGKQSSNNRPPISSRAANNRRIVYVDDDDNDHDTSNTTFNIDNSFGEILDQEATYNKRRVSYHNDQELKSQIKKSSDSLKQLSTSESGTPKQSKFKFSSSTDYNDGLEGSGENKSGNGLKLGRSLSIKSPKNLLSGINRHRRSISNVNGNGVSKDQNNGEYDVPEKRSRSKSKTSHSRSNSDILNSYSSDTSTIKGSSANTNSVPQNDAELRSMRSELVSMTSQVSTLKDELSSLLNTKADLTSEVGELQLMMSKLKFEIEKERKILEQTRAINDNVKAGDADDHNTNSTPYQSYSRNASENSIGTGGSDGDSYYNSASQMPLQQNHPHAQHSPHYHQHHHHGGNHKSKRGGAEISIESINNASASPNIDNLNTNNINLDSLNNRRPNLTISTGSPAFSVQPYTSSIITPTTDDINTHNGDYGNQSKLSSTSTAIVVEKGQIESVEMQSAVKPKVKARFWRSKHKGFGKFQKDNSEDYSAAGGNGGKSGAKIKISAPVLQHLDDEAFNQMNSKQRVNGAPNINTISNNSGAINGNSSGANNKITFLDKFSNSMSSSTSQGNLTGSSSNGGGLGSSLLEGLKSPLLSAGITAPNTGTTSSSGIGNTSVLSLVERAILEKRDIPLLVVICIKHIEKHGLYSEGIYRKSGGASQIQALEVAFEDINGKFGMNSDVDINSEEIEKILGVDINVVSSVLKRYLRRLPEPVILYELYDQYIACALIKRHDKKIEKLKSIMAQLPKQHMFTLQMVTKHLNLVSSYSDSNFMNLHNLAIVFAPSLVRDLTGEREIADMVNKNDVTEFLVSNYHQIF
ncbi:GTPase-activating protein [Saccharomycopsis crataegensis]|uniref:GTPase-activating protein n=1 Tax=Saccharomycopsis crataegensis TaxID=43959 RepID=A0AAV5QU22_9ASCO|nr:GTPase-activating protein [Saccharomycopsis crataegensis]